MNRGNEIDLLGLLLQNIAVLIKTEGVPGIQAAVFGDGFELQG